MLSENCFAALRTKLVCTLFMKKMNLIHSGSVAITVIFGIV